MWPSDKLPEETVICNKKAGTLYQPLSPGTSDNETVPRVRRSSIPSNLVLSPSGIPSGDFSLKAGMDYHICSQVLFDWKTHPEHSRDSVYLFQYITKKTSGLPPK